jgi:hypothetical protein
MECLVRQVHGHQVNLETVKVGLWVKELVLGVGLGLWDLTDKYTEEGSNANIGGKAPSGALSGAAMGAMLGPWGWWCINGGL